VGSLVLLGMPELRLASDTDVLQSGVDGSEAEGLGVVVVSGPGSPVLVVGVAGIGEYGEEFVVAAGSAAVFGRACACAVQAHRVSQAGPRGVGGDDTGVMVPAVTEVVFVGELLAWLGDGGEGVPDLGEHAELALGIGAVPAVRGGEAVQVGVGPSHRGLEYQVELIQPGAGRYKDAPPDPWRDVVEADLDGEGADSAADHGVKVMGALSRCLADERRMLRALT